MLMGCTSCGENKLNFRSIKEGWTNYIWPNKEMEVKANLRALKCAKCPKNVFGVCTDCGCPIIAKTRTEKETCSKWKQ